MSCIALKKKNQGFFPHVLPSVHWCLCSIRHTLKLSKHFIPKTVFVGVRMTNYSLKSCNFCSPTSVLVKWKVRFLQLCLPTQILSSLMSVNSVDTCPPVLCPLSNLHCICTLTRRGGLLFQPLYTSCKVADLLEVPVFIHTVEYWHTGWSIVVALFFKEAIFLVVQLF